MRGSERPSYDKLYKTQRWRKLRYRFLKAHPYCMCPKHAGQYVSANVVDHITPHRGDGRLMWNEQNLQSLTSTCHSSWKARVEKAVLQGLGCDPSGMPLDPEHHWYEG